MTTNKKQRFRYQAGVTALDIPKNFCQFPPLRPLTAETVTAATTYDPIDIGVTESGIASLEIFQAVSVTVQNQIDQRTPLCLLSDCLLYRIQHPAEAVANR